MKKLNMILLSMSLLSAQVATADVGLGVSAKTNDAWIYLPINVSDSFRIEPALRYVQGEDKDEYGTYEYQNYELSIGFFARLKLDEKVGLYSGARIGYVRTETSYDEGWYSNDYESDGYKLAPTLGIEYFLTKGFSIGAEAEWYYQDIDGERTQYGEEYDESNQSHGTGTRLLIRYMF